MPSLSKASSASYHRSDPQWSLFVMCATRSLDVLDGPADELARKPANVGTLCMKNFEPKLRPRATGTTFSLLAGILSEAASSQWKYVKFIEFA